MRLQQRGKFVANERGLIPRGFFVLSVAVLLLLLVIVIDFFRPSSIFLDYDYRYAEPEKEHERKWAETKSRLTSP